MSAAWTRTAFRSSRLSSRVKPGGPLSTVDTGFNGDLELPDALRAFVNPQFSGQTESILAGGQTILEDYYEITFSFDGRTVLAEATFVPGNEILVGTGLLEQYRLEIDFLRGTVLLERVA